MKYSNYHGQLTKHTSRAVADDSRAQKEHVIRFR